MLIGIRRKSSSNLKQSSLRDGVRSSIHSSSNSLNLMNHSNRENSPERSESVIPVFRVKIKRKLLADRKINPECPSSSFYYNQGIVMKEPQKKDSSFSINSLPDRKVKSIKKIYRNKVQKENNCAEALQKSRPSSGKLIKGSIALSIAKISRCFY